MILPLAYVLLALPGVLQDPPAASGPALAQPAPRITIVLVDDVGWDLWRAARTPHLDALAARGVTFTRAWAYPACSPARAALLTGRHAFRTGVGHVVLGQKGERGLALSETTLPELLSERCEAFGKWHVATGATNPNDAGFDHYAGCLGNLNGPGSHGYLRWAKTIDGETRLVSAYATRDTTDDALASQASFRYVAYHAAHRPLHWPPGVEEPELPGTPAVIQRGQVLAMIEYLDDEIGRLLADEEGYVFVLADNGSETLFGGDKGTISEAGVRVPFVVAGPGIEPAVRDDLVSVVDVFATVAELRGIALPPGVAEDSISLVPMLRGERGRRETVYVERVEPGAEMPERAIASRTHRLTIEADGREHLARLPDERAVLSPWPDEDAQAARFLRERLPGPLPGGAKR